MIDNNGRKHDETNGQFTYGSTAVENKRADEITEVKSLQTNELETPPTDITKILGTEYTGYKGQQAVDKLMQEKQGYVKGAFHREDIGDIDLLWGDDYCGLQHIIERRDEQGINTTEFVKDITETVENGAFRKKNERGNFEFLNNGKMAIVSPELRGNKLTFLVTAYKTSKKK